MKVLESLIGLHSIWQVELMLAVTVQVTVILCMGALAGRLVRAEAELRHRIWLTAIVASIVVPIVSAWVPALRLSVAVPQSLAYIDNPAQLEGARAVLATWLGTDPGPSVGLAVASNGPSLRDSPRGPGIFGWVLLFWLGGVAAVGARTLVGVRRLHVLARQAVLLSAGRIHDLAWVAARHVGLRRLPRIGLHGGFGAPVMFGDANPIVFLPPDAGSWTDARLRLVLSHELAHVRRRDWLLQMLARGVCAVNWFNPLVWMAARELRVAAEIACDQRAILRSVPGAALDYAEALVALAGNARTHRLDRAATAISFVDRGELHRRVRSLISGGAAASVPLVARRIAFLLLCLLPAVGMVRPMLGPCGGPWIQLGP